MNHLRKSNIQKLPEKTFDVLIIGGGINGAVSAASLAAKGAKVALIDKGDFAGFTSSNYKRRYAMSNEDDPSDNAARLYMC